MASSSPIDVRYISPLDLSAGVAAISAATDTPEGRNVIFRLAAVVWPADKAAEKEKSAMRVRKSGETTNRPIAEMGKILFMEIIATSIPLKSGPIKDATAVF